MKKVLVLLILYMPFFSSYAQDTAVKDPKVGLVLSGGGAKGLAHIGVLKVIEEAGIRIDYIAGTSMGAIIGGLYASGYSAHELDSIFRIIDFNALIQDNLPRSAKTLHEKRNEDRYALKLPFDNFKVSFPSAISKGQNAYNLFVRLLHHTRVVDNCSDLPIPFLCIATDVETGMPIVLDKGYLPKIIAASGAFPSLFEPIEIDGRLLIDGGVTNNYPIDEIKDLGADIIIGVDVQDNLADREALKSAPEILIQINNYRTVYDMKEKIEKTDIYIKPDIKDFSVISFEQGNQIIKNGQIAAESKLDELHKIAQLQQKIPKKKSIVIKDSILLDEIVIKGNTHHSRAYIKGKLRFNTKRKIAFQKLQQGISNLSATNEFEAIRYKLVPGEMGEELQLILKERKNTSFLKLAIHYDNLYKSAALFNVTKKRLLTNDDVVSLDIVLGDNVRYDFEYYIDKGMHWSFGLKSRYNTFSQGVGPNTARALIRKIIPLNKIDIELEDFTNQLYLQTLFREAFSFSIGAEHKRLHLRSETVADEDLEETTFEKNDFISTFATLIFDTYDNKYFPTKGIYFNGDFHLYLYSKQANNYNRFSIAKAKFGMAVPLIKRLTFNFTTEGGFELGNTSINSLNFFMGGYGNHFINNITSFQGYDFLSFSGDSYVKASGKIDYEFAAKNHIHFTANYANVGNKLFETGSWISLPKFSGYGIGYSLETFIGPIEARYTWSPELEKGSWFVNLGFWF